LEALTNAFEQVVHLCLSFLTGFCAGVNVDLDSSNTVHASVVVVRGEKGGDSVSSVSSCGQTSAMAPSSKASQLKGTCERGDGGGVRSFSSSKNDEASANECRAEVSRKGLGHFPAPRTFEDEVDNSPRFDNALKSFVVEVVLVLLENPCVSIAITWSKAAENIVAVVVVIVVVEIVFNCTIGCEM